MSRTRRRFLAALASSATVPAAVLASVPRQQLVALDRGVGGNHADLDYAVYMSHDGHAYCLEHGQIIGKFKPTGHVGLVYDGRMVTFTNNGWPAVKVLH